MTFVVNAELVARSSMMTIDPSLVDKYVLLIRFLSQYPELASKMRGYSSPPVGSVAYIERQAVYFSEARKPKAPKPPETIPDEMVSVILSEYFGIHTSNLERIKLEHQLSMGAENIVGDLLERYLASVLEPHGWIWCSGALVKAVDFIKPPRSLEQWRSLQVKNRDNSENSSSSAIRIGTSIEKWHRTFSKTGNTNWDNFPDGQLRSYFSERGFFEFTGYYLSKLK